MSKTDKQAPEAHLRLQAAREKAGYSSATAAANAFGWTVSTYLGHENGSRGFDVATAQKYAGAFGVNWTWLLGGAGGRSDLSEITDLLTPIPVIGIVEHGTFRLPDAKKPLFNQIFAQPFGWEPAALVAFEVAGARQHHFLICSTVGVPDVFLGDVLIVERKFEGRVERAAWEYSDNGDGPYLAPAFSPGVLVGPEPMSLLDEGEVIGVVVSQFIVYRRVVAGWQLPEY